MTGKLTKAEEAAAKAAKLAPAIADPDGDGKFPESDELTTSKRPGSEPDYGIGGMTTIGTDELGKNDVGIKNTEEFNKMMSATRATLSGDLTAGVYQRTKDGKTDTVTIYSNVAPDKGQAFNRYYAAAGNTLGDDDNPLPNRGSTYATSAAPSTSKAGTTSYNVLTFTANVDLQGMGRTVTGSGFPAEATGEETRQTTLDAEQKFTGTFHGIPGTYTCTAACTIQHTVAGGLQVTSGTLTFQPTATTDDTDDVHMIAGAIQDDDYLSFGYWVQTQGTGNDMKYGVNTFAGGSMPYGEEQDDGTITAVTLNGTATYEGPATGLYAYKTPSIEDGAVVYTPSASGQFVADTSLMAYFGNASGAGDSVAAEDSFTISGTVENFQDAEGNQIADGWMVNLNSADLGDNGTGLTSNTFAGTTGEGAMGGQWRGKFFGSVGDEVMPTGVAGEFTGHFDNGHVIGAFGATKKD